MRTSLSRVLGGIGLVVLSLAAAACRTDGSDDSDGTVSVVASVYPLAEMAERVGGDAVDVTTLTPAGTEPHDLELTPDQVDELLDADLVLYVGDGFQPAVEDVVEQREGPSIDLLEAIHVLGDDETDPHFWLDPLALADTAPAVADALGDLDSDGRDTFRRNADAYAGELMALDADFEAGLADCERELLVTSHAAFLYLTERYGLTQVPIAGLSPEVEPDPERLDEVARLVEDEGVTTIFHESLVAPDVAETLARETGTDTAVLNPLEGLTDDEIEAGEDYESMMRSNLEAIRTALGCA
jgi:zinc transport system substrate-binding protein